MSEVEHQTESRNSETLSRSIDNNVEFLNNKHNKSEALHLNLLHLKNVFEKCTHFMAEIDKFAGEYDYDELTPGNGYRSFLIIFDAAIRETSIVCDKLIMSRAKLLFRADNYAKYNVH
jgi:hormone-sensitive lipase